MDFNSFPLSKELLTVLSEQNFVSPTPIQSQCLPILLSGQDLLGQSQTGSGKTLAFILPILQNLELAIKIPQALILCPTRELCEQVTREFRRFGKHLMGLQVVSLVGGQPHAPQLQALEMGVHIIVGTPGRVLDFISSQSIPLMNLKTLVLDEADRMLDEGFIQEMSDILCQIPAKRQSVFFSATFSPEVLDLSLRYQMNPARVHIQPSLNATLNIESFVYFAENENKNEILLRILLQHPSHCTLIFCQTKRKVEEIQDIFQKLKARSGALHGDLSQIEREKILAQFRNGSLKILVATDVAARGLDIDQLELVINYDLPSTVDTYIHRVGRTGRAGRAGQAISIADGFEAIKISEYEKATQTKMKSPPLGFSNQLGLNREFQISKMKTLWIAGGRKDKLRPGDIVGTLTAEPQALDGSQIGKIEIHDHHTYVAIQSEEIEKALDKLRRGKIKGAKFKIQTL